MNAALPDVSLTDTAPKLSPLAWVGMQGIDLPVTVAESGYRRDLHARADVQVDLPVPQVKGIHMSRLYRLLDSLSQGEALSTPGLRQLLQAMIDSHQDCESRCARMVLSFDLLVKRSALISKGLSGWKSYPVRLNATLDAARRIEAALIAYSNPSVHVRHMESLHPHDAVAWTTSFQQGATA